MTKTKCTKRALLLSALSLLMCVSMLIGSTFAWFTDSVTSAGNKIQAGTLEIDLELLEKDGSWTSIKDSSKAIFDYDLWEPGYTDVKILKVTNEGTLALKWLAKFVSNNELSELAEVIDVYVKPSETDALTYPTSRDLLTEGYTNVGALDNFINSIETTTHGTLEAGKSAYLGIALKMQETAGNQYQGMDLGGAFDIQIVATQYTSESDSFNNQYDANAEMPGREATAEEKNALSVLLQTAENGETIYLDAIDYGKITLGGGHFNSSLPKNLTIVGDPSARIDLTIHAGDGNTISFDGLMDGWTFKNVVFDGTGLHLSGGASAKNLKLEGCVFGNGATYYSMSNNGGNTTDATFTDCLFYNTVAAPGSTNKNAISIQAAKDITVENCTFRDVRNAVNFGSTAEGTMVITGNTIDGTNDRVFRVTNTSATYTISNNTIVSNGNEDGQLALIKNAGNSSVILNGNTWNGSADDAITISTADGNYTIIK